MRKTIMKIFERYHISYEGAEIIGWSLLVTLLGSLIIPRFGWIFIVLFLFIVFTLRNPKRECADQDGAIYSPADGCIVDIETGRWDCTHFNQ